MVRKNLVNKFNHLLKEGNVYILKNFKVVENSGAFKIIDSKLKIMFTLLTKVEKVDTYVPSIPMHGFQHASEKTVNDRLNDDNILTDIIGCLTAVGDVETVKGGFRKRDLEIISKFNVTCKVTLWGALGETFDDSQFQQKSGVLNFATSSASKVYINLNADYVLALADRFANVCPRLHLEVSSGKVKRTVEEEMFENRMNIQQLLQAEWSNKPKGYIITILGVIEHIETQYGWFYLGCQGCCRKVNPIDGVYKCASCNVAYKNALTLFKLHLSVRDDTGVVNCVVFHKLAERMVDYSPLKLLNKSDPDKDNLPREITSVCGQKFVFCLQLSD
ncbi:replication factor A protein 1-like, partial [Cynara cardunculus var. scolymus]|uniref:replication factor A protein 1-like n=1 Tax=Cynara cardunculus var. scolymus TaxID=59895 RepID=UPI000D63151D